ncbi:MAG: hypothetical protein CMF48_04170 [Legionellales bacterium]|nr:hypothetical protein [Legionellales bacterium]|tara:strand:+ start:506 stop:2128 length:1623 start_codon:yes stop_codon:yes gene_type:complete
MPINESQRAAIASHWRMRKGYPLKVNDIDEVSPDGRPEIRLAPPEDNAYARDTRHIFNVLLNGDSLPKEIMSSYFLSVLIHPSNKLIQAIQTEIQLRLDALSDAIRRMPTPLPEENKTWVDAQLNNILSYAAFFEYASGSTMRIPVYNGTTYLDVEYEFERLNLTSTFVGSPYRAYGLRPRHEKDKEAPSQLLFMGTTFPGSSGFLWTLLADVFPLTSVGTILTFLGRNVLDRWINSQNKVIAHGQSLGGSMCINVALKYPDKVQQAFALVPAGHYRQKHKQCANNITVIYGGNDPVCIVGQMPKGCKYIYALPGDSVSTKRKGLMDALKSHALGLSCHPRTRLFKVQDDHMLKGARSRQLMGILHFMSWVVMFPLVLTALSINFFIRSFGKIFKLIGHYIDLAGELLLDNIPTIGKLTQAQTIRAKIGIYFQKIGKSFFKLGSILSPDGVRPVFIAPERTPTTDEQTVSSNHTLSNESENEDTLIADFEPLLATTSEPGILYNYWSFQATPGLDPKATGARLDDDLFEGSRLTSISCSA